MAERFITFGKKGDLAARRRVLRSITDKSVVHELFTVAPAMAERRWLHPSSRSVTRKGDNAPMAVIELVMGPLQPGLQLLGATKVAGRLLRLPRLKRLGACPQVPHAPWSRRGSRASG